MLSKEEWQHDWQNDQFLETMFLESDTDMACVHSVPVFDAYHNGLVSVEKGALPGRAHGGRVVRAAPDVAATGAPEKKRSPDTVVSQQRRMPIWRT